jgi:hypothetical protein
MTRRAPVTGRYVPVHKRLIFHARGGVTCSRQECNMLADFGPSELHGTSHLPHIARRRSVQ